MCHFRMKISTAYFDSIAITSFPSTRRIENCRIQFRHCFVIFSQFGYLNELWQQWKSSKIFVSSFAASIGWLEPSYICRTNYFRMMSKFNQRNFCTKFQAFEKIYIHMYFFGIGTGTEACYTANFSPRLLGKTETCTQLNNLNLRSCFFRKRFGIAAVKKDNRNVTSEWVRLMVSSTQNMKSDEIDEFVYNTSDMKWFSTKISESR